jgi:hypothetical protein
MPDSAHLMSARFKEGTRELEGTRNGEHNCMLSDAGAGGQQSLPSAASPRHTRTVRRTATNRWGCG